MRFALSDIAGAVKSALAEDTSRQMAVAATATLTQAQDEMKKRVRSNIASGGFSRKWQNAWRVNKYPAGKESISGAVFGYHKIPFSAVFETGATVTGRSGLLWIALPSAPKVGRFRATPRRLAEAGVKLFPMHGNKPILGANIKTATPGAITGKLSLSKLKRGTKGKRGTPQAVPLFVGVRSVTLKKRFHVSEVAAAISNELPALYDANMREASRG